MKYTGACHCGAVRFEVETKIESVMSCNCSICLKRGHLLAFAPKSDMKLISGENSLTDYQWGKKHLHFPFCKVCGVETYGYGAGPDGKDMVAINTRSLENFDLKSVPVNEYDGKKLPV